MQWRAAPTTITQRRELRLGLLVAYEKWLVELERFFDDADAFVGHLRLQRSLLVLATHDPLEHGVLEQRRALSVLPDELLEHLRLHVLLVHRILPSFSGLRFNCLNVHFRYFGLHTSPFFLGAGDLFRLQVLPG